MLLVRIVRWFAVPSTTSLVLIRTASNQVHSELLTPNSLYTSPDPVLHLMSAFLMYFSHHGLQQISKALMTGFIYIWSQVSIQASSHIIETQCSSAATEERRRRPQDHRLPQSIPGHLSSRLSQRCKHTHRVFRIWMRVCKCCSSIQNTSA